MIIVVNHSLNTVDYEGLISEVVLNFLFRFASRSVATFCDANLIYRGIRRVRGSSQVCLLIVFIGDTKTIFNILYF